MRSLVSVLALAACAETVPPTEVVVRVDAERDVRVRAACVRVEVQGTDGVERRDLVVPPWPRDVVVRAKGGDGTRRVRVVASAHPRAVGAACVGDALATARVDGGFASRRSVVLSVTLEDACLEVSCAEDRSCAAGECGPVSTYDASELPDWTGRSDGGPQVIDVDAGGAQDAAIADAGADEHDAGTPDAGDVAIDAGSCPLGEEAPAMPGDGLHLSRARRIADAPLSLQVEALPEDARGMPEDRWLLTWTSASSGGALGILDGALRDRTCGRAEATGDHLRVFVGVAGAHRVVRAAAEGVEVVELDGSATGVALPRCVASSVETASSDGAHHLACVVETGPTEDRGVWAHLRVGGVAPQSLRGVGYSLAGAEAAGQSLLTVEDAAGTVGMRYRDDAELVLGSTTSSASTFVPASAERALGLRTDYDFGVGDHVFRWFLCDLTRVSDPERCAFGDHTLAPPERLVTAYLGDDVWLTVAEIGDGYTWVKHSWESSEMTIESGPLAFPEGVEPRRGASLDLAADDGQALLLYECGDGLCAALLQG